jgi:hypothetical protein
MFIYVMDCFRADGPLEIAANLRPACGVRPVARSTNRLARGAFSSPFAPRSGQPHLTGQQAGLCITVIMAVRNCVIEFYEHLNQGFRSDVTGMEFA